MDSLSMIFLNPHSKLVESEYDAFAFTIASHGIINQQAASLWLFFLSCRRTNSKNRCAN